MRRKEASMASFHTKEVGREAEAYFEECLLRLGARRAHCPNGEDPGLLVAFEKASDRQDCNGVDFWVWFASEGCWVPVDLTIANGESTQEYLAGKCRRGAAKGIVVVKLRKRSLELAARGAEEYLRFVREDFLAAVRDQLPSIRKRLYTRADCK
jgi:hypothetical protein